MFEAVGAFKEGSITKEEFLDMFIEFAVNIPAHDPHVGQAFCSISKNSSLVIEPSLKEHVDHVQECSQQIL
jgi:hypothetical protein